MSYESIFDQSYERVLAHSVDGQDFFSAFYQRFLAASPEVREKFQHTDMAQQRHMLKKSFYSLLVFYASNAADDYLNKIVEKHGQKGISIPEHLYDVWLECLIDTVRVYDSQCDAEVTLAWRLVMSSGVTYMKYKHS